MVGSRIAAPEPMDAQTGRSLPNAGEVIEPRALAARLARLPRPMLLATDIDGTLAPLAATPPEAQLEPGARAALVDLAVRGVAVAVVSGRSRDELVNHFELPPHLHLIGSHGAEPAGASRPSQQEQSLVEHVAQELAGIAALHPNARVETKPYAAALHVRGCEPEVANAAVLAVRRLFAWDDRVRILGGHAVVEVAVSRTSKSLAVGTLREQLRPISVVFIGDDLADEAVFATLRDPDVGVKVGPGDTAATYRLATPRDVVAMLAALVERL